MSSLLNIYCHGYVVTPIIEACQRHGLFERLDKNTFREREWIIKELEANVGYFTVALQALASLGWLEINNTAYRLSDQENSNFFNLNLTSLYDPEPWKLIREETHARKLCEIIEEVCLNSRAEDSFSSKLAQGAVILPLVSALKGLDIDNFPNELSQFNSNLAHAIEKLFIRQQWLTADKALLTADGKQLLQTNFFGELAYCRTLLSGIEDLLFGNHADVFSDNLTAKEGNLCGQFNIIDLLHESYSEDLRQEIIAIFDQQPLGRQPLAIVNVGCGNGFLLKEVHQTIRDRTVRGQHLEKSPIQLIGIDDNQQVFEESAKALSGLKHWTFLGNSIQPDEVNQAIEQNGLLKKQQILHIRSFVDHRIHIDSKQPSNTALSILARDQPAFYLDGNGQLLDASMVLSRWHQHLQALADNMHESHLLILGAHAVPDRPIRQYLNQPEYFCLDIICNLSREYLISAEAFITLAASVGLFNQNHVKRYPKISDSCQATLHHLSKRDYIVRHATGNDFARLCQLEKLCWQHTRASRRQIHARLREYPQGQFVLEKEGEVLGVIYSQRISSIEELEYHNAANVHELHRESGSIIQLLAVNIDPRAQNLGYGDQLLEFMLQRCSLVEGIRQVVGVTICKNYRVNGEQTFEEYIQQQGSNQDPVLAFHQTHGARIVKALAGYRPEDSANQEYGVLVEYDILNRATQLQRIEAWEPKSGTTERALAISDEQISQFVKEKASLLLGINKSEFDSGRPLMEMGLDSADLLKLQQQIEEEYGQKFKSGFFFEYNTVDKVISYLTKKLAAVSCADELNQMTLDKNNEDSGGKSGKRQISAQTGKHSKEAAATDIAVVGMSCKLPGGIETPAQLWQVLASESCVVSSYPKTRGPWPVSADKPGIDQGGFIDQADAFDAAFFRISPTEAQVTDPQQRILLELAWACFEDAAILPETLKGTSTGVFIGASNCDYSRLIQAAKIETQAHHATGSSLAVLANRLSYFFDLSGPSLLIDTACSASLIALHTAVKSLLSGECEAALVGGVNLICHPDLSIAYHKAGMLAPDGRCKTFDVKANGYVRSEGAVMFLLKPLSKAIEERGQIHAVIKGSAINHGGLAGGLTVPNPQKQCELLIAAWENAGISPEDLSYIEAHGTGTPLGDPIEIQGIQAAYAQLASPRGATKCGIGSVKSNLGHLEAAAGITGLLKVILAMQHEQIPASVNFERLNPKISLKGTPFYISDKHRQWEVEQPRIAGVSSFGSGGANAHVVIEEWVRKETTDTREESYLLVVSAKNKERLVAYAESILSWIEHYSDGVSFADFIYTFQVGRTAMEERLAVQATGFADLSSQLSRWVGTGEASGTVWQENTGQAYGKLSLLLQGNTGNQILAAAVAGKNLKQLALLWASGFNIDFEALYKEVPLRISAPSYPFLRKKYWIDAPLEEKLADSLLGFQASSQNGTVFSKTWDGLPEYTLFTQDDFSCLSLGFILEIFVSVGDRLSPHLEITCIENFNYYPFHLEEGMQMTYETRCYHQGLRLLVELVQIIGQEQILIAEAELEYSENNTNELAVDFPQPDSGWINLEERYVYASNRLPIETLKCIFPALLNGVSAPIVSISKILFYRFVVLSPSMLVALNPGNISVLTSEKQPVLSIIPSIV